MSVEMRTDYEEKKPVTAKQLQPDWKNPPTIEKLNDDIKNAEGDFNDHINDVKKWLDLRDSRLKIKIPKGKSRVSPKVIRKQAEWRYSSLEEPLLASEDMYDVEPMTYADKAGSVDHCMVLNKQFSYDIDRVDFINDYIRTDVDEGMVVVRVGWKYKEDYI